MPGRPISSISARQVGRTVTLSLISYLRAQRRPHPRVAGGDQDHRWCPSWRHGAAREHAAGGCRPLLGALIAPGGSADKHLAREALHGWGNWLEGGLGRTSEADRGVRKWSWASERSCQKLERAWAWQRRGDHRGVEREDRGGLQHARNAGPSAAVLGAEPWKGKKGRRDGGQFGVHLRGRMCVRGEWDGEEAWRLFIREMVSHGPTWLSRAGGRARHARPRGRGQREARLHQRIKESEARSMARLQGTRRSVGSGRRYPLGARQVLDTGLALRARSSVVMGKNTKTRACLGLTKGREVRLVARGLGLGCWLMP
jgi:hypothetical protein